VIHGAVGDGKTLVKLAIPVLRRDLSIEGAGKHQPR
jgi:hypothetical protein